MELDLDAGQWIVIVLSALLFLWYVLATLANRKQSTAAFRWLRQCLETYGKVSSAEWIGASNMGARLTVEKAASPVGRIQAHYVLEPREFLPYWLLTRLRGQRERAVIQVTMRTKPKGNLEVKRVAGRQAEKLPGDQRIQQDFQIVRQSEECADMMAEVEAYLASSGSAVERIVIQRHAPHIELEARLKPLMHASPEACVGSLLAMCQGT